MTKERLKELRKEAGLTQNQVAEMIGVQGRNYQRLEMSEIHLVEKTGGKSGDFRFGDET